MGLARLPDGRLVEYDEYIHNEPYWKKVREQRFAADSGLCVLCHENLRHKRYETHHVFYDRLGHEHLGDVITLCPDCHTKFHTWWTKTEYWTRNTGGHWNNYDFATSCKIAKYAVENDILLNAESTINMCNLEEIKKIIKAQGEGKSVDASDIQLTVRDFRYSKWFSAEKLGITKDDFLNMEFGPKIYRVKNERYDLAKTFFTKHKPESYHNHFCENEFSTKIYNYLKEALLCRNQTIMTT